MPCFRPIRGRRDPDGRVRVGGRFDQLEMGVEVPCGRCVGCRVEHRRQWTLRLLHEKRYHDSQQRGSIFLTLTYDDAHLPQDGSLDVRHWQAFMKRLRRRVPEKLRFFTVAEYGDQTHRPHFHSILFGHDFPDRRPHSDNLFTSATIEKAWGMGHAPFGTVTADSISYVAGYAFKKVHGSGADRHYKGRRPEFSVMSRRPGIGRPWFDSFKSDWYPSDECIMNGRAVRPPKRYDKWLEVDDPELYTSTLLRREASYEPSDEETPDRRATREKVMEAFIAQKGRDRV